MNISGILAKGAGAAGIGLLAYDAHHEAKEHSQMYSTRKKTDNIESLYYDTLSLSTPSRVKDKAKKAVLDLEMDTNIDTVFYRIGGYVKSLGESVVSKAIPLGLSALALLTKGVVSKASALGLAAYAAVDFMGEFGHKK
ncbi:hypothetical protein IJ732_06695 [bacterium]|nr:hypothetical protein [bacterium]